MYTKKRLMEVSSVKPTDKIDKEMIPILIELNSKNYFTKFSCQGHGNNCAPT